MEAEYRWIMWSSGAINHTEVKATTPARMGTCSTRAAMMRIYTYIYMQSVIGCNSSSSALSQLPGTYPG